MRADLNLYPAPLHKDSDKNWESFCILALDAVEGMAPPPRAQGSTSSGLSEAQENAGATVVPLLGIAIFLRPVALPSLTAARRRRVTHHPSSLQDRDICHAFLRVRRRPTRMHPLAR